MDYCTFCQKFGSTNRVSEWYDEVLLENEYFVAAPALGQLVEGYLLAIPQLHVTSVGNLDEKSFELFLTFVQRVQNVISSKYGRSVIFEHGSLGSTGRAGCCVDHAHWHIIPFNLDPLSTLVKDGYLGSSIINPRQLRHLAGIGIPYLFFQNQLGEMWLYQAPSVPSQLFRRILAKQIGREDEWDYAVFPFEENLKRTISTLRLEEGD